MTPADLRDRLLGATGKAAAVLGTLFFLSQFGYAAMHRDWSAAIQSFGYAALAGIGIANAYTGRKTQRVIAESEAEKRIQNPQLPASSNVPEVQKEIARQVNGETDLMAAAAKIESELSSFDPLTLTPERLAAAAAVHLPERLVSAVWVHVFTGVPDAGVKVELFRKKAFTLDALLGTRTYGAVAGYQFAQRGSLLASVFAGAAHPYGGELTRGWQPVIGIGAGVRF